MKKREGYAIIYRLISGHFGKLQGMKHQYFHKVILISLKMLKSLKQKAPEYS